MSQIRNVILTTTENILKSKPEGKQYDLANSTIDKWPEWKKEIFNRLLQITT
jgi:hypothetical protein